MNSLYSLRDFISKKGAKAVMCAKDKSFLSLGSISNKVGTEEDSGWVDSSSESGACYSVGQLWLCALHGSSALEYRKQSKAEGICQVSTGDREPVLKFLQGQLSLEDVKAHLKPETFQSLKQLEGSSLDLGKKREAKQLDKAQAKEEQKVEEKQAEKRLIDYAQENEIKLSSRQTCLAAKHKSFLSVLQFSYLMMDQKDKSERVKKRIEERAKKYGPSEVAIDLSFFKTSARKSLIQEILQGRSGNMFEEKGRPIIIVPGVGQDGQLCMSNVKAFLSNYRYELPDENWEGSGPVTVERKIGEDNVTFEIISSGETNLFRNSHWDRVVAMVSNGTEFQFKGWPHQGKFVELFLRVKAFFVMFDDTQQPDVCKKFNIKKILLKRAQRHKDRQQAEELWRDLERFLKQPRFGLPLRI